MLEVLHRMQIFQWNEQFIIIGQWENICIIIPRSIVRVLLLPGPGQKISFLKFYFFPILFFLSLQNNDSIQVKL